MNLGISDVDQPRNDAVLASARLENSIDKDLYVHSEPGIGLISRSCIDCEISGMGVQMPKTRVSTLAVVSVLVLFSYNAAAQSDFYIFGAFGNANSDIQLGGQNRVDDDDSSYVLGAGYAFTRNFSLEAAYQDFGSHNGETDCPPGFACLVIPLSTKADVTGVSLSLIGNLPITDRLDVYGKFGLVSWDLDFEGISSAFDDSGKDLHYGAGLRGSIDEHWQVFAEYRRIHLDIGTAAMGLSYRF